MHAETLPRPADPVEMLRDHPAAGPDPLLVDFPGLAKLLCRSVASLYRDRAAGRLPLRTIRLGTSVRFCTEEVRAWVRAGCPDRRTWEALRDSAAQRNGRPR